MTESKGVLPPKEAFHGGEPAVRDDDIAEKRIRFKQLACRAL
jgi:hypothetical protein